mmetsp:Transcript_41620/g.109867  ORF Transcript_41620/g.109867 Transcript_41620/m.109867 type:complete len:213 (-) Transcript_41620:3-641(-)
MSHQNCSRATSDSLTHWSCLAACNSPWSSAPTGCSSPAIRNCSEVCENHQTISHAGDRLIWATFPLLASVIMRSASAPPLDSAARKPRKTTVRQQGRPSLSTVAIWTKFPPRISLEPLMDLSIRDLHASGSPPSSGAAPPPFGAMSPRPTEPAVAMSLARFWPCRVVAVRPAKQIWRKRPWRKHAVTIARRSRRPTGNRAACGSIRGRGGVA